MTRHWDGAAWREEHATLDRTSPAYPPRRVLTGRVVRIARAWDTPCGWHARVDVPGRPDMWEAWYHPNECGGDPFPGARAAERAALAAS